MLCCCDFCINVADISFMNRFLRMLKYVYMPFTHMSSEAAWSGDGDWLMELDALGSALLRRHRGAQHPHQCARRQPHDGGMLMHRVVSMIFFCTGDLDLDFESCLLFEDV